MKSIAPHAKMWYYKRNKIKKYALSLFDGLDYGQNIYFVFSIFSEIHFEIITV